MARGAKSGKGSKGGPPDDTDEPKKLPRQKADWANYIPKGLDQPTVAWAKRHIADSTLSQAAIARRIGMREQQMSNALNKKRRFTIGEVNKLASLFGTSPPGDTSAAQAGTAPPVMLVNVVGRIALGSAFQPRIIRRVAGMVSDRFPPVDQHGFEVGDTIPDASLIVDDILFAVSFKEYAPEARHGSMVLFKVSHGDVLESWSLGRIVMQRGVQTFVSVLGDIPAGAKPSFLVIAMRRDYFLA